MPAKREPIIPLLYFILLVCLSHLLQSLKHFLLCKSKRRSIFLRCGGHNLQIIQIRKNGFFAHSGDSCHQPSLQIEVCLKCTVKQTSDKSGKFFPVSIHICFLQRSIIFVQQNNRFFSIIPVHTDGKSVKCHRCYRI